MIALMEALKANSESLKEVYLHDNQIKAEAVDRLVEFILKAQKLERLNVSDSNMGTAAAVLVVKALSESEGIRSTLKSFSCNYNEIETQKASILILDTLLNDNFSALESVEYKGNSLGAKKAADYIAKFTEKGRKLIIFEEDEEEEEDLEEEEEEEEDEDDGFDEESIIKKLEKLRL